MQNIADLNLTDAEATQLVQALQTMTAILEPRFAALTPGQRQELLKMGDSTRAFCAQAVTALNNHADNLPRNFALDELNTDWSDLNKLEPVVARVRDLAEKLDDTLMAVGSDVMTACVTGVGMLKAINRADPTLDVLLADLRASRRRRPAPKPAATAP